MYKIIWVLLVFFLVFIFVRTTYKLGVNNLNNPNLWYDESGQFWIAKGLNHFSAPLEAEVGIVSVMQQNSVFNLDPGGFSLLLHFWSKVSNDPFWLKMLPYLFYLITCVGLAYLSYIWSKSTLFSLVILNFLPILKGNLTNMGFLVRAYSMEVCGIVLGFLALEGIVRNKSKSKSAFFGFGLLLALFMTSRYSFSFYALALIVIVVVKKLGTRRTLPYFLTSIVLCATLIYVLAFRFHSQQEVDYLVPPMLAGKDSLTIFQIFFRNLFWPKTIGMTALVVGYFVLRKFGNKTIKNFELLTYYIIYSQIMLVVLSFAGIHPWDIADRWSIGLNTLGVMGFVAITSLVVNGLKKILHPGVWLIVPILVAVIYMRPIYHKVMNFGHYFATSGDSTYANINAIGLEKLDFNVIYVATSSTPTVRYLFEYGPFKGFKGYPENFIFNHKATHIADEIDVVITTDFNETWDNLDQDYDDVTTYYPTRVFFRKVI